MEYHIVKTRVIWFIIFFSTLLLYTALCTRMLDFVEYSIVMAGELNFSTNLFLACAINMAVRDLLV